MLFTLRPAIGTCKLNNHLLPLFWPPSTYKTMVVQKEKQPWNIHEGVKELLGNHANYTPAQGHYPL